MVQQVKRFGWWAGIPILITVMVYVVAVSRATVTSSDLEHHRCYDTHVLPSLGAATTKDVERIETRLDRMENKQDVLLERITEGCK